LTRDVAKAYTAFETVDIEWSDPVKPGLRLTNTRHIYYQSDCACDHCTQQVPHRQVSDALTPAIYLSEGGVWPRLGGADRLPGVPDAPATRTYTRIPA